MAHVGSFSHFVFVIVIVFVFVFVVVFVFVRVFVIVITGAPVYSTCHKLSENLWVAWFKTS